MSKFMPIRLDPGTMMKPKSKMKVFAKDDSMSEMHHTNGSTRNNRVATMLRDGRANAGGQ